MLVRRRYRVIDILRGLALFFILLYNISYFVLPVNLETYAYMFSSGVENILSWVVLILVNGKGHVLFSFLFGLSFYYYNKSYGYFDFSITVNYIRRMIGLVLIGALHLILLWSGDILLLYGLLGITLLYFRNKSNSSVLQWIVVLFGISLISNLLIGLNLVVVNESVVQVGGKYFSIIDVLQNGSYFDVLIYRLNNEFIGVFFGLLVFASSVIGFFLMGLLFGRFGLLGTSYCYLRQVKYISWYAAGLILVVMNFYVLVGSGYIFKFWENALLFLPVISYLVSILNLIFVVAVVFLLARVKSFDRIFNFIATVGKMSLTNYIMQTLIMVLIFYGYGLGYLGKLDMTQGIVLAIYIYLFQVVFSNIWLRYFKYGLLEWLLRMVTDWKVVTWRVTSGPE